MSTPVRHLDSHMITANISDASFGRVKVDVEGFNTGVYRKRGYRRSIAAHLGDLVDAVTFARENGIDVTLRIHDRSTSRVLVPGYVGGWVELNREQNATRARQVANDLAARWQPGVDSGVTLAGTCRREA